MGEQVEWQGEVETKVEAADGVGEVLYPWSIAQLALDQIDDTIEGIGAEQGTRGDMVNGAGNGQSSLQEWSGPFRDEFDLVAAEYDGDAEALKLWLAGIAGGILDAAALANEEQERRNGEAGTGANGG